MRIEDHPIINFDKGELVTFTFNGEQVQGYTKETVAAALHAAGIKLLSHSQRFHRPRGLYCAIGNCSSCLMQVNGKPNVRICVTYVQAGMEVEVQQGKGELVAGN